jgi:major membrane immunogen (membrane-anchored lipoprotein)
MKKVMVGVALVATLALAGCSGSGKSDFSEETPAPEAPSAVQRGTDADSFKENIITLNDGRTVVCLTWSEYDSWNETKASGLDCDWERTKE